MSSEPARLHKIHDDTSVNATEAIEAWCLRHAPIVLFLILIILFLLFIVLVFTIVGTSATESGTMYNQFDRIVEGGGFIDLSL